MVISGALAPKENCVNRIAKEKVDVKGGMEVEKLRGLALAPIRFPHRSPTRIPHRDLLFLDRIHRMRNAAR